MEVLKDIFVSYDIAVQLKEIGFDELCVFYYNAYRELMLQTNGTVYWHKQDSVKRYNYNSDGNNEYLVSAPAWEQVFKWFREKNIISEILPIVSVVNKNIKRYIFCVYDLREESQGIEQNNIGSVTYEEAREQLILKLIEIYKNDR